jgi:hypothetical protein
MKNKITLFIIIFSFIGLSNVVNAQNVNIPDANFKAALVGNSSINTNADGEIQVSEAAVYTDTIDVTYLGISSLTGIEAFNVITKLDCSHNPLTGLNVSANTALTYLNCSVNQLTSLNVSANTALTYLNCSVNQLTSLDVSANMILKALDCHYNQISGLDVSANSALRNLDCYSNQLTSLNVFANTALVWLDCRSNQLTSLNVSGATTLTVLICYSNKLTSLNISANTSLVGLDCSNNQLTNLDVSANTALKHFYCDHNKLMILDVSTNSGLEWLWCFNNQLTSLDLSANSALENLWCLNNLLTSLNVKNGNNINIGGYYKFDATNNYNLKCIQVDDALYSNSNWHKDATASFSEYCNITSIAKLSKEDDIAIYPNPGNGVFTLTNNLTYELKLNIEIVDVAGQLVKSINQPKFNSGINSIEIDISELSNGIYFLKVFNDSFNQTLKVFKK